MGITSLAAAARVALTKPSQWSFSWEVNVDVWFDNARHDHVRSYVYHITYGMCWKLKNRRGRASYFSTLIKKNVDWIRFEYPWNDDVCGEQGVACWEERWEGLDRLGGLIIGGGSDQDRRNCISTSRRRCHFDTGLWTHENEKLYQICWL